MDIITPNVPLAPLCSFKTGGSAHYYLAPKNENEVLTGLRWAADNSIDVFILGNGTNVVFSDQGYDGLIIHTAKLSYTIKWDGMDVTAGSGVSLNTLVKQSVKQNAAGIQKLAGIPGTVGGSVYMNAGAFGQEVCQVIQKVVSCGKDGCFIERTGSQCEFSYRSSIFNKTDEIILNTTFRLQAANREILEKEYTDISLRRKSKHPLEYPNAGSIFKRPRDNYAGHLIEQAGLKGKTCGGACVSEKHANFIVNLGGCAAQDIYDLSSEIIRIVKETSGIELEREVKFIGKFLPWPR